MRCIPRGLNAQGKRHRSTEGAQGTNKGQDNGETLALVGVRLTDQLGWGWLLDLAISLLLAFVALGAKELSVFGRRATFVKVDYLNLVCNSLEMIVHCDEKRAFDMRNASVDQVSTVKPVESVQLHQWRRFMNQRYVNGIDKGLLVHQVELTKNLLPFAMHL